MKTLTPLLSLLIFIQCTGLQHDQTNDSKSKYTEFTTYENGLIYDEPTMSLLARFADSLNLNFKSHTAKTYYSLEQGYGSYFSLGQKYKRRALKAIANGITLNDFKKLFPRSEQSDSIWIVKSSDRDDGKPVVSYESDGEGYIRVMVPDTPQFNKTQGWTYEETYDGIDVLYLYHLKSTPIPAEYSSMIQYVDCMIDTTATIYPDTTLVFDVREFYKNSRMKVFMDLAKDFEPEPAEPSWPNNSTEYSILRHKYDSTLHGWNARRMSALDEKMKNPENARLFNEALQEAFHHQTGWVLADYAERYLTAPKLLEFKRSYRVPRICNFDSGPRDHARAICMLAVECHQWDVFLRAHMDILNDHVSRNIGEIQGRASRVTYIQEIEELSINRINLLVGTMLNAKNLSRNHYQASSWRIGETMSDSKNKNEFEDLMVKMICDERLDIYNRMEITLAFLAYNDHGRDETTCRRNLEKIRYAVEKLPAGIEERFPRWWKTD